MGRKKIERPALCVDCGGPNDSLRKKRYTRCQVCFRVYAKKCWEKTAQAAELAMVRQNRAPDTVPKVKREDTFGACLLQDLFCNWKPASFDLVSRYNLLSGTCTPDPAPESAMTG